MSRHRNVRSMNYNDEYDGYDDVYGHSVEDDYCVSPSEAAFMYDREGSKNKQKIGAFFQTVNDIAEENEGEIESKEASLSDFDKTRLESCIDQIKQVIGNTVPRPELVNIILLYNFNVEKAINFILGCPQYNHNLSEKKDDYLFKKSTKNFAIPKLNGVNMKPIMNFKREPLKCDSSNFSSLNELSRSHLQNVNTVTELKMTFNNKQKFGKKASTTVSVLSKDLSKINLHNKAIKSDNEMQADNDTLDNCQIDLTKALRGVTSAPQLRSQIKVSESFTPTFIDCEIVIPNSKVTPSICNLNISMKLSKKKIRFKQVSAFGKVLCLHYTRAAPVISHNYESAYSGIAQFLFDSPSPDDIRISTLHKHLQLRK